MRGGELKVFVSPHIADTLLRCCCSLQPLTGNLSPHLWADSRPAARVWKRMTAAVFVFVAETLAPILWPSATADASLLPLRCSFGNRFERLGLCFSVSAYHVRLAFLVCWCRASLVPRKENALHCTVLSRVWPQIWHVYANTFTFEIGRFNRHWYASQAWIWKVLSAVECG